MARIGFVPSKTSIEVREPDGDAGTIPAASEASAGVMTARHVQMLEEVYRALAAQGSSVTPIVIERPADMSQFMTKDEVRRLLAAMPKAMDMGPEVRALRGELMAIQQESTQSARLLLAAPPTSVDVVDQTARAVLDTFAAGMEGIDHRLRQVESVIDTLRMVADIKGSEAA